MSNSKSNIIIEGLSVINESIDNALIDSIRKVLLEYANNSSNPVKNTECNTKLAEYLDSVGIGEGIAVIVRKLKRINMYTKVKNGVWQVEFSNYKVLTTHLAGLLMATVASHRNMNFKKDFLLLSKSEYAGYLNATYMFRYDFADTSWTIDKNKSVDNIKYINVKRNSRGGYVVFGTPLLDKDIKEIASCSNTKLLIQYLRSVDASQV